MINLKVISFCENRMSSRCSVVSTEDNSFYVGESIYVDLTVNADFGKMPEKELIGKTVTVERFQPCEFLGIGVSICE